MAFASAINDSQGFVSGISSNTVIGTLMREGSSGPWLNNFGVRPTLTGAVNGSAAGANIIVGVTSWIYTDDAAKQAGASPFTSNNVASMVSIACTATPEASL